MFTYIMSVLYIHHVCPLPPVLALASVIKLFKISPQMRAGERIQIKYLGPKINILAEDIHRLLGVPIFDEHSLMIR